jgi:hypothetical protein
MRKTFIETREFTEWVQEYLSDELLAGLQRELLNDPEKGIGIPGSGGLRGYTKKGRTEGKGTGSEPARCLSPFPPPSRWG